LFAEVLVFLSPPEFFPSFVETETAVFLFSGEPFSFPLHKSPEETLSGLGKTFLN